MVRLILKQLRENRGISQAALAQKLGIRQSTIGMWESGKNTPDRMNLEKLSDYFGVSVDYLLGRDASPLDGPPASTGGVWVPVLGKVAAGVPIEAIENIEDYEELALSQEAGKEYFALRIKGDSMEPKISDGDVVIVHRQADCESGDVAVVLVNGSDATVKKIKKEPAGLILLATNPAYEPRYFSSEEINELPVTILGRVIEVRGKL